ncbi:hypothetical protein CRG98_038903 [Punica granatum]|uniref:Uncharacterized protein n=1 Tax=Punica granatum TaxID=22663 RepID=A0A2I0I9R0_PUNGR|nr:hypothetical protein CRG98_038903 [Punica granatum]
MNPETQSDSGSMVLVILGCVQAYFRLPFTCPRIGRPGSPFRKASANVQECPGLSRRLLKYARRNNNANYQIYGKRIKTPKVDEMGHVNETRTRMGCPFLSIDRGVSVSLTPRRSLDYEMTIMPLDDKVCEVHV